MNLPAAPSQVVSPTLLLSGSEARAYAEDLAKSDMLSSFFQGSVANVMFAMELGKSYNLEPAALLQNIHVFETWKDGKATLKASLSANLMVHLARHAGHIVTTKANQNKATCTIVRGDTIFAKMLRGDISGEDLEHYSKILSTLKEMDMDPKAYAVTESIWTMDKAHTAGLVKEKGNWAKYPHAMLAARSKADAVRMACEEVLITINNQADRIGGGFVDREGRQISTSWTHLADELGGSINEDDGSYVSSGNQPNRRSNVIAATAPREYVETTEAHGSRPHVASPDDQLAKADLAAQASADPSKAGWAQREETAKKNSQQDAVRKFVETKDFPEVTKLLGSILSGDGLSASDQVTRKDMLLKAIAEVSTVEQVVTVCSMTLDVLDAVASHSEAPTVAAVIQEIALDESVGSEERLQIVFGAYKHIKELGRMDDPAPFRDKRAEIDYESLSLGEAMRIIVQPLIKKS